MTTETEETWEFGSLGWCEYAASLGVGMLEQANLDLDGLEWGFSEDYTYPPERLRAGRDKVGYYFCVSGGKITGGAGVPETCLALPGFHARLPWGSIAHASSFLYGRDGQKQRSADEAVMWQALDEIAPMAEKTSIMLKTPVWPPGIGQALSVDSENGGGLHNLTAKRLKPSPEVCDLPQTKWGVPIISEMTEQQKVDFLKLIGR